MVRSGWRIALESAHILLEGAPDGLDPAQVELTLRAVIPQLDEVHHVHSWSLTDEQSIVTLHAKIKQGSNSDQCIQDITRVLERKFNVSHATIQIEYDYCSGPAH
jgi:cobalt-zinc-cadmium efflux system protein